MQSLLFAPTEADRLRVAEPTPKGPPVIGSRPKRVTPQGMLFDPGRMFETMGQARGLVGDYFEDLTAELMGIELFAADSRADICPDGRDPFDRDNWVEIKSIGLNDAAIIYDGRLAKDRDLIESTGKRLLYFFWKHNLSVSDSIEWSREIVDLRYELRRHVRRLVIVDFEDLEKLCATLPTRVMNTGMKIIKTGKMIGQACGYGKKGYERGWSPSMRKLRSIALHVEEFDLFV
jgi:hypothetical protein